MVESFLYSVAHGEEILCFGKPQYPSDRLLFLSVLVRQSSCYYTKCNDELILFLQLFL